MGQIVAAYGRRYRVELADASTLDCVTRGRRGALACGDRVSVARTSAGHGVIEAAAPRSTLLYRSDHARQKLIAANVTQIVVVVAPVPAFHEDLVNRCLAAAIQPCSDSTARWATAWWRCRPSTTWRRSCST